MEEQKVDEATIDFNEECIHALMTSVTRYGEDVQDVDKLLALLRETALIFKPSKSLDSERSYEDDDDDDDEKDEKISTEFGEKCIHALMTLIARYGEDVQDMDKLLDRLRETALIFKSND